MLKLGKEKGCEKICDWMKGVRNHLYWGVTSTKLGYDHIIAAKWNSFMRHVANKHDGHGKDFNECAHGDIGSRRWIKIGKGKYLSSCKNPKYLKLYSDWFLPPTVVCTLSI